MLFSHPQAEASWRSRPAQTRFQRDRFIYCLPCWAGARVIEIVGEVRQKNDKRWEWFRRPAMFYAHAWPTPSVVQGVCATRAEAQAQVERGWNPATLADGLLAVLPACC